MKKRPPSMARSASSPLASKGSMASSNAATSPGVSASASTKKPSSSYWRACSLVRVRNGPLWSAQENAVLSWWTAGPATLMTR